MFYIWAWLVLYTFVSIVLPQSIAFSLLTLLTLTTLLLWVFLCGGPSAMYEVLEARTQPRIPLVPPHPARRPVVVVIGSATGLGQQVAALCRRKKYIVQEGDVQFSGAKHCDLTSIPSIQKFVATIITTIDVLVLSAGICDATGVPISGQQSIHPRMLWVNFLGQVCFLEEAKKQGIAIQIFIDHLFCTVANVVRHKCHHGESRPHAVDHGGPTCTFTALANVWIDEGSVVSIAERSRQNSHVLH
jgi:NAD(P)-dependent dehydrogenase (short-subunit alcohol dehydrogenase family)